ncbi:MAG: GMP reductase [Nanobdellota archaeon]
MRIDNEPKLDFDDVLIRPKRSTLNSRKEVALERRFKFLHSRREWTGIPIIPSNMDTTGTFEMARVLSEYKMITALHKFYSLEELEGFFRSFDKPDYIAYTLGIRDEDFDKLKKLLEKGLGSKFNFIVLDVPNAYLERFVGKLSELRELCPNHTIIAGNVVTNDMTEEILLKGADIVKIGIGSGASCLTRRKTGVGYPQLGAIMECSDAAHGITGREKGHGLIVSDGGIRYPGDIAKAFCAASDFVMGGSIFAGHDETGGELIEKNGRKFKKFYGMSSKAAMKEHYGKVAKHRTSEGRDLEIPYKGSINNLLLDIFGSLRSTGTYIGAWSLKEFPRRATFMTVHKQLNTSLEKYQVGN